jgi:cation diffusion facilitator CzcD-associated flavoprotein CzcO
VSPRIAIIGAGFGGIGVALKLHAAGHRDIVVYERAPAIGGTWHYNTYPGAACDAPSHVYSYSFAQQVDWSRRFAPGDEILAYLERCVTEGGIADMIHTATEVTGAHWTDGQWSIDLSDGRTDRADVLIPALGQLNVPAAPTITGLDRFRGTGFHSARWRDDVSLEGKRVAVIGTGASAIQIIPAIADEAEHLTVFQRSAPYVMSKPDAPYSDRLQRRYRSAPLLRSIARRMIWTYLEIATVGFDRFPKALGILQLYHGRILAGAVADPALRAKLTPDHRIGCKRILISNDYYATLARPDVTLVTDPIETVTEDGIQTGSGLHPADVIVFATGFETTPMLSGTTIVGRSGIALNDRWSEREGAYLGLSVPDFPNMFLIYGPNTNLGSGSIIYMLEAQADHVVDAVGILARDKGAVVEVTESAYRQFLADNDKAHRRAVWSNCRSWYQDAAGRNTHNWPWTMTSYRRRTRRVDREAYRVSSES